MDSDSDDDDYAFFGTPLESLEEGSAAKRRPPALEDQTVRDARGRQRFHGAFTGGFSAGFFNTVGSRDGFKPAVFVSSRSSRAEHAAAKPEDFMDEEDRGEHGIAPQRVQAKPEFQEDPTDDRKRRRPQFNEGPIPGEPVLEQLVKPVRDTVGVHILKAMGWRPGQGIGPRITRREKKRALKVYGCAPPPGAAADADSDSEDSDSALREVLLAPDDSESPLVRPKDDRFGLGYRGLERRPVLGPGAGDSTLRYRDRKGKLAIAGQAFGVGAFEEEDADIYATEDMSNYDFEDAPERSGRRKPQPASLASLSQVLEGFHLAATKQPARPRYPPPPLPPGFKPQHKARVSRFELVPEQRRGLERHSLSAQQRSQMIGETAADDSSAPSGGAEKQPLSAASEVTTEPAVGASPSSQKASDARSSLAPPSSLGGTAPTQSAPACPSQSRAAGAPSVASSNLSAEDGARLEEVHKLLAAAAKTEPAGGGTALKPFARDPSKQKRYEHFLVLQAANRKDDYRLLLPASHTSWEREREVAEFSRAAALFRPLAASLADKFVSAGTVEEERTERSAGKREEDDPAAAAARKKMFGVMTRSTQVWRPASLLCRRFNVKDPFPQSNLVGTAGGGTSRAPLAATLALTAASAEDRRPSSPASDPAPAQQLPPRPRSKAGRLAWEWLISEEDAAGTVVAPQSEAAAVPAAQSAAAAVSAAQLAAAPDQRTEATAADDPSPAHLPPKKPPPDLFKAIFDNSSSEESDGDEEGEPGPAATSPAAAVSTSAAVSEPALDASTAPQQQPETSQRTGSRWEPPRRPASPAARAVRDGASAFLDGTPATAAAKKAGFSLFDGVDLEEVNNWQRSSELPTRLADPPVAPVRVSVPSSDDEYGPKLPPRPPGDSTVAKSKDPVVVTLSTDSEHDVKKWREKSSSKSSKKKKHKREKKKKSRRRSRDARDSESESGDADDSPVDKLKRVNSKKKKKKSRH